MTLRTLALALLLPSAIACSAAADATEGTGESTSHLEQGSTSKSSHAAKSDDGEPAFTCTGPSKNPSCDVKPFIENMWELAQEEPMDNTAGIIVAAAGCLDGLVAIGVIAGGSDGLAVPVVLSVKGVIDALGVTVGCYDTAKYINETGILQNIDCLLQPEINTPAENVCECTFECNSGVEYDVDRGYTGMTKYKYGFQDRIGSANCHCTDDPKAVRCQLNCKRWASDEANDCTCAESF